MRRVEETIPVRFRWSEEEFVLAHRIYLRSSASRYLVWFAWAFFFVCAYLAYANWSPGYGWQGIVYSLILFLCGTIVLVVRGPGQFWLIRRAFRKRPDLERDLHYEFDENGFKTRTEGLAASEAAWALIQRAVLAPEGTLLFQTPRQYMYVSGSGFADVASRERFDALVRQKVERVVNLD